MASAKTEEQANQKHRISDGARVRMATIPHHVSREKFSSGDRLPHWQNDRSAYRPP